MVAGKEVEHVAVGRHRIAGEGEIPVGCGERAGEFVDHQAAWVDEPAEFFVEYSQPWTQGFPGIDCDGAAGFRVDEPAQRKPPFGLFDGGAQQREVIGMPPVVIVEVGDERRVGEVGERAAQRPAIAGAVQAAMPGGGGKTEPENLNCAIGGTGGAGGVQYREVTSRAVYADENVDAAGEFLAEDAFKGRLQLWTQDGGYDDGGVRWDLNVRVGVGSEEAMHELIGLDDRDIAPLNVPLAF